MTLDFERAPKVSVVVVSYNTRKMTLDCLRSIAAQTSLPHEIVVVDNASGDGSAEAIAAEFPGVRLLAERANHGFALANNIAAQVCRGDYILLLNPDTVVLGHAIDRLVAFAEARPDAMIWGGRTLFGDGSLNTTNCWRRMTLWSLVSQAAGLNSIFRNSAVFNPEAYGGWPRDSEREVDIVTGCLLLIERCTWQLLEGFDPTYVMYGEEADLCLRARALGARPRISPEVEVIHYKGASEKIRADKLIRLMRAKISLIDAHFPPASRSLGRFLFGLWPLSRNVFATLLGRHEARATWSEVWRRRSEWRGGWAPVARPAVAPSSRSTA
ncbi:glycosyltransferase family 2 protein [Roseivivax marinus]|uniref:glycosyltransferase family 2 protein n=1 Tax=Roseivivax marinus TaxID=1379903 RepID=UPI001F03B5CD|nr:glycosyltransferase family 2 protein [Roseivivax marinus]UMA63307.1 glycosyltransferase family 2 protein [Roseivivax marinus]